MPDYVETADGRRLLLAPDEVIASAAEIAALRAVADAADRVAHLVSILGEAGREYVKFTEREDDERVATVRALWDALDFVR